MPTVQQLDVETYLSKFKDSNVDFFRFPGNYGDSLIWHGTKILLASLNITERYVDITTPKFNDVLFIDGGGNLVDYYSDIRDFLIKKPALYDEIVILPHTIFGDRQIEVLNNVSSKLTVFCREKVTAATLEGGLHHGNVYLWHDCAFYNKLPQVSIGKGILNAFRLDKESILATLPEANMDLTLKGYATKPLGELINTLQQYEEINTDRLHVAIGAALLGKRVKLFPNSYYKNKAVYDYSLARYSNVRFIEKLNQR